jgi:hypothetical protein
MMVRTGRRRSGVDSAAVEIAQLLMRDLTQTFFERLKRRAKAHARSLEGEDKVTLETETPFTMEEAARIAMQWRRRLAGRMTSDSADLLREDRDR